MKSVLAMLAILLFAGLAAGCGSSQSASDKAKSNVCSAVTDIKTHVDSLQSVTLATVTSGAAQADLQAIQTDLKTISDNKDQLASDFKAQLETATTAFTTSVTQATSSLGSTTSLADAATAIKTATGQLATAYTQAFAGLGCS